MAQFVVDRKTLRRERGAGISQFRAKNLPDFASIFLIFF